MKLRKLLRGDDVLTEEIAKYLNSLGIVTFDETGQGGDTFLSVMPSSPDEAVAIFNTGGTGTDRWNDYNQPTIQFIVRGTQDPRVSYQKSQGIHKALNGLCDVQLGAFYIVNCYSVQGSPIDIGQDDNYRHEQSINFQLEVKEMN